MRHTPSEAYADLMRGFRDRDEPEPEGVAHADWKEGVSHVLDLVDEQLRPHGLEVDLFDTRTDSYGWRIVPIEAPVELDASDHGVGVWCPGLGRTVRECGRPCVGMICLRVTAATDRALRVHRRRES